MSAEVENTMTLTGSRALVTEQATQNESYPALDVMRPEMTVPLHCLPVTDATVIELYEYVFAPRVKMLGLREFEVCPDIGSGCFRKMMRSNYQVVRYVVRQLWQPLTRLHHCLWHDGSHH